MNGTLISGLDIAKKIIFTHYGTVTNQAAFLRAMLDERDWPDHAGLPGRRGSGGSGRSATGTQRVWTALRIRRGWTTCRAGRPSTCGNGSGFTAARQRATTTT